ncbi:DTW domain-containing protein [Vibrio sp. JPW-9-11-11]|uniref:tRNA-uridine aminocarboxypropyltransferase n=1 Tax=Vibrio sp. JPW-9-11-11 TaxID=1416532 RepID=UPI00159422FA|nr:DTW domain-containing protein [Vibrio sp. JPW-9-11-11]NVD08181.1 DTW domain-containing protein [Vibrio sp. JPW-9-11-11]
MTAPPACPGCQLRFQCVCHLIPQIDAELHIALLMHPNEPTRDTNTGRWLEKSLISSSRHIWQRTQACPELIKLIQSEHYQAYLLYPAEDSQPIVTLTGNTSQQQKQPLLIILDGTWQEANKMLRKSDWLQALPKLQLQPTTNSQYRLRRNQQPGHLCTLEVGVQAISELGYRPQAQQLEAFFHHYLDVFQADKSGHALKQTQD